MHDLKSALRSLLSTPGTTLVVVATLSIAIGVNTALFSVVDGVLLRPFGYQDESSLVVLWATQASDDSETFRLSPADYRDLRDGAESFAGHVVLYRSIGSTLTGLTGLDRPTRVGSLSVTPRVFRVLGAKPAAGHLFADEDEKPGSGRKVVLTYASWTRRFGADPSIAGSTLELDGEPYTVVGVAEPGFQFPPGNADVEMFFPMTLSDAVLLDRSHRMFDAVARLADGVTLEAANAELSVIGERLGREFPDTNAGWRVRAHPLREEMLGGLATTLSVLSGAVFLVLLVACANVANVLVARSAAASREYAVRAALGARSRDLLRRSLAESAILGLLGSLAGLAPAFWGVRLLRSLLPADIPRAAQIELDSSVLLFAVGLSIGATLLFGAVPALRSMAPDAVEALRPARALGTGGARRLRELMVVVEVALAIVLLVGAGLMLRSFVRLSEVDPGFRREGVVSVGVPLPRTHFSRAEWKPFFERLVDRVEALPGVRVAGAVSDLPMSDVGLALEMEFTVVGLDAVSPTARPNADFRLVLPGYFEAMDMKIRRGRAFDRLDGSRERAVGIVNETLVERYFPDLDPIGRSLRVSMLGEIEIVGVVSDIRHAGLASRYESEIYLPYGRPATNEMQLVVLSDLDTGAVASAVSDVLQDMNPDLAPSHVAAMSDLLWESVARPRFQTALLSGLALAAALLAVVGTYGIVAYSVSQRRGEIGLRMALGADAAATVGMILREALAIVLAGAVLGIVAALLATQLMTQLLFAIEPTDPFTYAVVLAGSLLVGAIAAWLSARRATRVDPVVALRAE